MHVIKNKIKSSLIVILCLIVTSCTNKVENDDFFAMDTYMNIIYLDGDRALSAEIKELVFEKEKKFKIGNVDLTDKETSDLCRRACAVGDFTGGSLDITVAPLCEAWGFWGGDFRVPSDKEIKEKLEFVGYKNISLNEENVSVPQGFSLDFGAVAKGYTGECIANLLENKKVGNALISLGGNIVAYGDNNGKKWKIGIKNPFGDGNLGYVEVENKSVVTSGGYERFFEFDGKKYSHIINPFTGYPSENDIASVTVISEDGLLADGLSTAFYVLGAEKSEKIILNSGCKFEESEFAVVMILGNKEIKIYGDTDYRRGV